MLSSRVKMPFLSDPGYLKYKGFMEADIAWPDYELLYLPLEPNAPVPRFKDCAKRGEIAEPGMVLYYSNQCPFTCAYVPFIQAMAEQYGAAIDLCQIDTTEQAQNAPAPFTAYSFFYNGKLVTHEIMSEKKFEKSLEAKKPA